MTTNEKNKPKKAGKPSSSKKQQHNDNSDDDDDDDNDFIDDDDDSDVVFIESSTVKKSSSSSSSSSKVSNSAFYTKKATSSSPFKLSEATRLAALKEKLNARDKKAFKVFESTSGFDLNNTRPAADPPVGNDALVCVIYAPSSNSNPSLLLFHH